MVYIFIYSRNLSIEMAFVNSSASLMSKTQNALGKAGIHYRDLAHAQKTAVHQLLYHLVTPFP